MHRKQACAAHVSPKIVSSWEKADLVQMMNLPTWPPGASCSKTQRGWLSIGSRAQQQEQACQLQTDKQTAARGQLQPSTAGRVQRQKEATHRQWCRHTSNSMLCFSCQLSRVNMATVL